MKDGEKIGGEFGFLAGFHVWVENHEFSTVFFDKESKGINAEPCKSVTVGNHNLEFVSAQESFQ